MYNVLLISTFLSLYISGCELIRRPSYVISYHETALINNTNPVVDRIIDGETVDTVIMANQAGTPIFTNIALPVATRYAERMRLLGDMVQHSVKEMDLFDEALVFRLKSCKEEVLVAPHQEFSIVVVQRERKKVKQETKIQIEMRKQETSVK